MIGAVPIRSLRYSGEEEYKLPSPKRRVQRVIIQVIRLWCFALVKTSVYKTRMDTASEIFGLRPVSDAYESTRFTTCTPRWGSRIRAT